MNSSTGEQLYGGDAPRLVRASTQLLVLTPIRLGLGVGGLVAAIAAGLRPAVAAAAFALGAIASTTLIVSDRRFQRDRLGEPLPLPAGASEASRWEVARAGIFPSTVGVAVLTVAALIVNGTLAALLAGVLAGMGIASLVSWAYLDSIERRRDYRLYVERGPRGRAFAGPR